MSQVLNPKPMRRNLIRFQLREHFSMGGKKKKPWRTAPTFQPTREVNLLSQLKEALLEFYLWWHSSFMCMMPVPFSP